MFSGSEFSSGTAYELQNTQARKAVVRMRTFDLRLSPVKMFLPNLFVEFNTSTDELA